MLLLIGVSAFVLSIFTPQALAQNSNLTFNWRFAADTSSLALPICQAIPIVVFPNPKNSTAGNYSGEPPYYMMAFPENGQPITSNIGNDGSILSWTPTHPVGTKISLQLTDSITNTGGAGGHVYYIVENPDGKTDCTAAPPPTDFSLSSNMTQDGQTTLQTCQLWRLNINGGQPPYTLVLNAKNSPILTNISVPLGNDAVVYANRADPNTLIFAGAVDNSGRWAAGTQFVKTYGSSDITCPGSRTIVTTKYQLDIPDLKAFKNRRRLLILACITAGLVLLTLLVGGLGISWNIQQKRLNKTGFLK